MTMLLLMAVGLAYALVWVLEQLTSKTIPSNNDEVMRAMNATRNTPKEQRKIYKQTVKYYK